MDQYNAHLIFLTSAEEGEFPLGHQETCEIMRAVCPRTNNLWLRIFTNSFIFIPFNIYIFAITGSQQKGVEVQTLAD